jgi:hypothetical protein
MSYRDVPTTREEFLTLRLDFTPVIAGEPRGHKRHQELHEYVNQKLSEGWRVKTLAQSSEAAATMITIVLEQVVL